MSRDRSPGFRSLHRARRTDWRWPVGSGLALIACVALLYAAFSGVFRVRHVDVVGANVPVDEIVAAAQISGQNVFEVQSDEVASRLGAVREIVVHRVDVSFPDRVKIYVSLRPSFVAWQVGSSLYELDPHGQIVRQVDRTALPVIQAPNPRLAPGPAVIQAVRYARSTLPGRPDGRIAAFRLEPAGGLVILGRGGWRAEIGAGTPQTLLNRVATLGSVLDAVQRRQKRLSYIDLRPGQPYVRLIGA